MDGPCVPSSIGEWPKAAESGAQKSAKKAGKKSKSKSKKSSEKSTEKAKVAKSKESTEVVIGTVKQSVLVTTECIGKDVKSFDAILFWLNGYNECRCRYFQLLIIITIIISIIFQISFRYIIYKY